VNEYSIVTLETRRRPQESGRVIFVTSTSTAMPPANAWAYPAQPVHPESSYTGLPSERRVSAFRYTTPVAYLLAAPFHSDNASDNVHISVVAARPAQTAQARARAVEILRSWLEPHESDDQAAAFRQLKDDLNESRSGQRKLFRD